MAELPVFDRGFIDRIVNVVRAVEGWIIGDRSEEDLDHHQAPEVYVAETPPAGVAARKGKRPGRAKLKIYKLEPVVAGSAICDITPVILPDGSHKKETVYNLSNTRIYADYVRIDRDKFGKWLLDCPCGDVASSASSSSFSSSSDSSSSSSGSSSSSSSDSDSSSDGSSDSASSTSDSASDSSSDTSSSTSESSGSRGGPTCTTPPNSWCTWWWFESGGCFVILQNCQGWNFPGPYACGDLPGCSPPNSALCWCYSTNCYGVVTIDDAIGDPWYQGGGYFITPCHAPTI